MRRTLVALTALLIILVAVDQVVRARLTDEVATAAATGFSAASADADVPGALVLPQLLSGRIGELRVDLADGVVGDPVVRVARLEVALVDVETSFPPPTSLRAVTVAGGTLVITVHEREVERLFGQTRPGWDVEVGEDGLHATGTVDGLRVAVTAEVTVEGNALRIRAREVDAGAVDPALSRAVAAAFDTTIPVDGLPATVLLRRARPTAGALVLDADIAPGVLDLG